MHPRTREEDDRCRCMVYAIRIGQLATSLQRQTVTYTPCLSLKEDYPALLRTKINVGGSKTCRFWNMFGKRIEAPENMKECMLVPRVVVRSLWVMGSECGLIIEVTDMMYDEKEEECPFPIDQPLL